MIEHRSHIYGVIGEFEKPEQLVHAAAKIREAGYRYYECYTPFPVEGHAGGHGNAAQYGSADHSDRRPGRRAERFWLSILGERL